MYAAGEHNRTVRCSYRREKTIKFEIVPEEQGNALKTEETSQDIINALVTGRTPIDLEADGCYKEPAVYQNDETLVRNCELINKLTDVVVTYDFDDRTETVDKEVIKNLADNRT